MSKQRMISGKKLDIQGEVFGMTFNDPETGQVTLWLEDDEMWHEAVIFAAFWMNDLDRTVHQGLRELWRRKDTPDEDDV